MIDEYDQKTRNMLTSFISKIYTDKATIYRTNEITLANQSTRNEYVLHNINIKCRLSKMSSRKEKRYENTPESSVNSEARLYCNCDTDIIKGDKILVDRGNEGRYILEYYAGQPFYYASHMEVPLSVSFEL